MFPTIYMRVCAINFRKNSSCNWEGISPLKIIAPVGIAFSTSKAIICIKELSRKSCTCCSHGAVRRQQLWPEESEGRGYNICERLLALTDEMQLCFDLFDKLTWRSTQLDR
jgi:hypothetical protein